MTLPARLLSSAVIAALTAFVIVACTTPSEQGLAPAADGGDEATAAAAWTAGPCGACAVSSCARERALCDAEPSCVAHAACAEACPAAADGRIDAECLAGCPLVEESGGARVRAAYDTCLAGRGPAACEACSKTAALPSLASITQQKCAPSTETVACHKCESERCCDTFQGCVDEPECKQVLQGCVVACGSDKECVAQCYSDHPKGVLPWARRQACMMARCKTECGAPIDACVKCEVDGPCREARMRCASDEGCFLIEACLDATCPNVTDACLRACKEQVAIESGRLFDEWISCALLSCGDVCG